MTPDDRQRKANEWPDDQTIRHRDRLRREDFGVEPPPTPGISHRCALLKILVLLLALALLAVVAWRFLA